MQYKPGNWVTGFKRSPRAANVQHRDMGLFLNSSGKFEPIDDSWDNLHSGGLFISDDNKLYFRDETNKDIYINSPADNQITIGATSGVGINTTPAETFHVVDTTSEGGVLIDNTATDGNPILAFGLSGTKTFTMGVDDGDSDKFKIFSGTAIDGTSEFVIDGSGQVGIGASSPRGPLDIIDASTGNPDVLTIQSTYNATGDGPAIRFDEDNSSNWTLARIIAREQTSYAGYLSFQTNVGGSASNTTTEKMRIDKDGNVGIGPTAPGTLFEMTGTAPYLTIKNSTHEDTEGGRESKIIFEGEQSGGEITTLAQIQASHDGTSDDEKGDLIFSTNDGNDAAAPTERMRIDSAGNVGIGVTPRDDWAANYTAMQIGPQGSLANYSDGRTIVGDNWYDDGAYKYIATDFASRYSQHNGEHLFDVAVSGSADGTITWLRAMDIEQGRDVKIEAGNLVIGTAGKGIDFSAQTATATGTTTAELLNHYEEGTFTPVVSDGTNNATMDSSYGWNLHYYTRIGRVVSCTGFLNTDGMGSVSGALRVTGLPFTAGAKYSAACGAYASGMVITAGQTVGLRVITGQTYAYLTIWDATTGTTQLTSTQWNDGAMMISFTYML